MNLTMPPLGITQSNDDHKKENYIGWTLQYANHFLSLSTINDKLKYIQNIFHICDDDYNYNPFSTFLVDFHLGNATFCVDSHFNDKQTFFVCKSLSTLLDDAVSASTNQNIDYDSLRDQLAHKFQLLFKCSNTEFSVQEIKSILSFITSTFLRPLRIILLQIQNQFYYTEYTEIKKIFQPPIPDPLSEFTQDLNANQFEFTSSNIFNGSQQPITDFVEQPKSSKLEFPMSIISNDPKKIMSDFEKYKTVMKQTAEKRLNILQARIDELALKLKNEH